MITTRTPYRISFFGGGTDYPGYSSRHGGMVLSSSINKYCYLMVRSLPPFFDHRYRIRYNENELVKKISEIKHPSVRECLKFMEMDECLEIVHTGDIPARSGVGSSSAFTVGLLHALYSLKGEMVTKRKLALDAIHVEQNLIGEPVGSQDQTVAAFGGLNKIEFKKDGNIVVDPVIISKEKLDRIQDCMLFYFTGISRNSMDISEEQIKKTDALTSELDTMKSMVTDAMDVLNGSYQNIDDFGRLLDKSWQVKRGLTDLVSNSTIDSIYEKAMKNGALGGKLCGAGGGGFILIYVTPEKREKVKAALSDYLLVPMKFETLGSHVAFYSWY